MKLNARTPLIKKIPRHLSTHPRRLFSRSELETIITDYAHAVREPLDTSVEVYFDYMLENGIIRELQIKGEKRCIKRYTARQEISIFEIAASLQKNGYLSHLSAAWIHHLVVEQPAMIYVSVEGTKREKITTDVSQENINEAFQKPQRKSGALFTWEQNSFVLLTALNAGGEGIEKRRYYTVSSVERTLIDMVVRTAYSGGPKTVLSAFQKAMPLFSMSNLIRMFYDLGYTYPYHQSIGFYLSLAGYKNQPDLERLKKMGMSRTFYLDYEIRDPIYSDEWNLYFPAALLT